MAADAPAPPVIHALPLDAIDAAALTRDRTGLDPEPFTALQRSILVTGLRSPVEVFPFSEAAPADGPRYGLIAGYRRLMALRALRDAGHDGFDTIPAIIRDVSGAAEACRLMVEENAVRAEVSVWETALLVVRAADGRVFPSIESAVEGLHPTATRSKQSRLRRIAHVAAALEGLFTAPERLSERQLLRIGAALDAGFQAPIELALEATLKASPERQWSAVLPYLAEHETPPAASEPAPHRPGRPRRALSLRRTLAVRREKTREGYVLRFSGPEASSPLLDEVLDQIEKLYSPA